MNLSISANYGVGQSESYGWLGYLFMQKGDIPLALEFYEKNLKIDKELGNKKGMAICYLNVGHIYKQQGDIPLAIEYLTKSLKTNKEIGDQNGIANAYNHIGIIHNHQGDLDLALKYYNKALKIREEIDDKRGMGSSYNNIGLIYQYKGNFPMAIEYLTKSLNVHKEAGDIEGVASSYNNLGMIQQQQGNLEIALEYLIKSLKINEEIDDKDGMASSFYNVGDIYNKQGNVAKALEFGLKSMEIAKEIGYPSEIEKASQLLSDVYLKLGNNTKALEMYKLSITMRDSINNETTQKATAQQQAKYEYEKQKVLDDAEHDKLLAVEKEEKEKQQILTGATAGGLILVVVFLFFVFNRLQVTKKQKLVIEEQKKEVEQQKGVVEIAHFELEEKNQEILDSITYAKRIQSAILPPAKVVAAYLQESFILYKPKDIVAGDFYWLEPEKNRVLFAAADCTGHGVPGAMVSVVCNNALNRSVREHGLTDPGEILTKTREIVIKEFEKSDEDVKDGMDIALCSLEGNKLQYAGAHNPLWIIRKNELIETKADKQPIGQFDNPQPYTTHSFELEKGDSIYIFSDGFVDQFGGEKGKKFKTKAFRELFLSIQDKSMNDQKTIVDNVFETWRGGLEQIDDVCVIGVRV